MRPRAGNPNRRPVGRTSVRNLPGVGREIDRESEAALGCVDDEIVVEGRQLITPYFFSPGVLIPFPSRRRKESNPPVALRRRTGFEDREGHQPPFASGPILAIRFRS